MESDVTEQNGPVQLQPKWKPLPALERRVVGVLVEKAKTTPDAYPLSLNALVSGCNQKSNRHPKMDLSPEQSDEVLERLRHLGAVGEVQGGGRVPRYRHYMKDWLGVDGTELAVVTELLLRGSQTVGELRGRAARMGNIPDVAALRPILQSLMQKGLVIALTPEGRGQVVSHNLYEEKELASLRREYGTDGPTAPPPAPVGAAPPPASPSAAPPAPTVSTSTSAPAAVSQPASASSQVAADVGEIAELRRELSEVRTEVAKLRRDIDDLWANLR